MNAVAANLNFQPDIVAAFAAMPAAPEATPAFSSLINLLLMPQDAGESEQTESAALPSAPSAQQIADAMIRSMLGGAGTSSNIYSDTAAVKKPRNADEAVSQPATQAAIPVAAPIPIPTALPALTSAAQTSANGFAASRPYQPNDKCGKLPQGTATVAAAAQPAGRAELAFALRLTPLQETQTPAAPDPASAVDAPPPNSPSAPLPQPAPIVTPDASQPPPPRQPDRPKAAQPAHTDLSSDAKSQHAAEFREDFIPGVTAVAAAASGSNQTDGFSQAAPFATPVPARIQAAAPHAAPPANLAAAIRTSEPAPLQPAPAIHSGSAQEIAVRIARPDAPGVDVHFVERAGQVQVSVRTPDTAMQASLRQDLGTLVNSLERSGYRAESLAPIGETPLQANAASQTSAQSGQDESGQGSGSNWQGHHNPGGQQQQNQSGRNPRQFWIEELEQSA